MTIVNPVGQKLAMVRSWQSQSVKIADDGIRGGYESAADKVIEKLSVMDKLVDAITTNKTLSELGMEQKLIELAAATLKDFNWLFSKADESDAAYNRLHAVLFAMPETPKGFSEMALLFREQELRTWIRGMSQPQRMNAYQLALQHGDMETVLAVKRAPGLALLPVEMVERLDREYLDQAKPEEARRLESLNVLRTHLRAIAAMLQSWLSSYEKPVRK